MMKIRNFRPIDLPIQFREYYTKYPHGMTIFESLIEWVNSNNDVINNVNDLNHYMDDFINQWQGEMKEEVKTTLEDWKNDGVFDLIVADVLNSFVEDINKKVDSIFVNVLDFGATGDGVTDDTIAIQSAINSVNGKGTVFIPKGHYITTKTLYFEKQTNILGSGVGNTIIEKKGNGTTNINRSYQHTESLPVVYADNIDAVIMSLDRAGDFEISNIEFRADENNRNDFGILIPYSYRVKLSNLMILYAKENVRFYQTWNTQVSKVRSRFADYGFRIDGLGGPSNPEQSTSIHFDVTYSDYAKFGYKFRNITYFNGSSMSSDNGEECHYWFEFCIGAINGLGIERGEGQMIRNWLSVMSISGIFSMGLRNHSRVNEGAKSKAKIEVYSENRPNTGLFIVSSEFRTLSGTGESKLAHLEGNSFLLFLNVRNLMSFSKNDYIEEGSQFNLLGRYNEFNSIVMGKDSQGYNITGEVMDIDGFKYIDTTTGSKNYVDIPLTEIKKRLPNFFLSDGYVSIPHEISIYSQNSATIGYYTRGRLLIDTHIKQIGSTPPVIESISEEGENVRFTFSNSISYFYISIKEF